MFHPLIRLAICLGLGAFPLAGHAQGPLQPPAAPAATMKTLDQIHDRIANAEEVLERRIAITSLPVNIIRSGSYYLTASATFSETTGNAINVTVSNVTIDLMGFTLSSTAGVTGDAIRINAGLRNITVRNGAIAGTTTVTFVGGFPPSWQKAPGGFRFGIETQSGISETTSCHFSDLRISGCREGGLRARDGVVIERVTAAHNGSKGIECESGSIKHCSANLNFGQGMLASSGSITDSTATRNGEDGIVGHAISHSSATGNQESGFAGNTITGCSAQSNLGIGIVANDGSVINCTAESNIGSGIQAVNGVVAFCTARFNASPNIDAGGGVLTGNKSN